MISFRSGADHWQLTEAWEKKDISESRRRIAYLLFIPAQKQRATLSLPCVATGNHSHHGNPRLQVERKWAHARLHTEKWSVRALHGRLHWLSHTLSELRADRLTQWQEVHDAPHVYGQNKQEPGGAWEFKKTHNSNTHQPRHLLFLYSIHLCIHLLTDGQALSLGWLSFIGLF